MRDVRVKGVELGRKKQIRKCLGGESFGLGGLRNEEDMCQTEQALGRRALAFQAGKTAGLSQCYRLLGLWEGAKSGL